MVRDLWSDEQIPRDVLGRRWWREAAVLLAGKHETDNNPSSHSDLRRLSQRPIRILKNPPARTRGYDMKSAA
jgi:hypothetical protein